MCGIVGIIAKTKTKGFVYKHSSMFKQMLFADTLRGKDSTGIYFVNKYGNVEWAKEASPAPTFLVDTDIDKMLNTISWDSVIVVGHNRAATIGNKTDENAHPFIEDNIILVHNGTIRNKAELNSDVEVDSHAICHAIKEFGIVDALPLIDGAFALACYDINSKQFYLVRNDQRPLYFAESEDFWIFGSEPWLLHGMAWRNGFKLEKLREVPEATLFSFKIRDENEIEFFEEPVSFTKPVKIRARKHRGNNTIIDLPVKAKVIALPAPSFKEKTVAKLLKKVINHTPEVPPKIPYTWQVNDIVCFIPESSETINGTKTTRIIGHHSLFKTVEISCYVDKDYTIAEIAKLMSAEILVADVESIVYRKGDTRLYVRGPAVSRPVLSRNNFSVNEELMCALTFCSETGCHNEITDDIVEDSYIKVTPQTGKIKCACPECINNHLKTNPAWGNILAHDQVRAQSVGTIQ